MNTCRNVSLGMLSFIPVYDTQTHTRVTHTYKHTHTHTHTHTQTTPTSNTPICSTTLRYVSCALQPTHLFTKSYGKVAGASAHIQSSDCAIQWQFNNLQLRHILLGGVQRVGLASDAHLGSLLGRLVRGLQVPIEVDADIAGQAFPCFLLFQSDDVVLCLM